MRDYIWGNRNKELVCYYLKFFDLDEEIVSTINRSIKAIYPVNDFKGEIVDFYNNNSLIKQKHNVISKENGDQVPSSIKV